MLLLRMRVVSSCLLLLVSRYRGGVLLLLIRCRHALMRRLKGSRCVSSNSRWEKGRLVLLLL